MQRETSTRLLNSDLTVIIFCALNGSGNDENLDQLGGKFTSQRIFFNH